MPLHENRPADLIDFSKYDVSLDVLNIQHREVFHILEFLLKEIASADDNVSAILLHDSLDKLRCHAHAHFDLEELLMGVVYYPEELTAKHTAEHTRFMGVILGLEYQSYPKLRVYSLISELFQHLETHINTADRHLAEHIVEKQQLLK